MAGVLTVEVAEADAGLRLDRWFKRHYPDLGHGRLEKLLRTGQVRVGGGRVRASRRLEAGEEVRVPPLPSPTSRKKSPVKAKPAVSDSDTELLRALILHRDDHVIALNKPAGLAVQGGTNTPRHLDGMLDALRFDAPDRPRLVHRLDKDTSGVLLLGRNPAAAAKLTAAFRGTEVEKTYWALVMGVPRPRHGRVDLALAKVGGRGHERMAPDASGKRAISLYTTIEVVGRRAAWLGLRPLTGRTHQLRVHCLAAGVPIVGDGKYGGAEAFLEGQVSRKLHLHARSIDLPHPRGGRLQVTAPLRDHMAETWATLGLDPDFSEDPFA